MGEKTGSPPLYLVVSTPDSSRPLLARDAAVQLERCRAMLLESGHAETVRLLDIVLLQLRMELRGVSEAELKELCAELSQRSANEDICQADGACAPSA